MEYVLSPEEMVAQTSGCLALDVTRPTQQQASQANQVSSDADFQSIADGICALDVWNQLLTPLTNSFPLDNGCAHVDLGSLPQTGFSQETGLYLSPSEDDDGVLGVLAGIFLDHIHPSMPFFKRSYLLDNLGLKRQEHDISFNALIHAICALTLLQTSHRSGPTILPNRKEQAETLMSRAVQLHSSTNLGEAPTLENVLTSIFLFACQFCRENHNAAKFRLREASTLAEIMKLGELQAYGWLAPDERDRRLRTVLGLTLLERVYAIQRAYPLNEKSLTRGHVHVIQGMLEQGFSNYELQDLQAVSSLKDMIESFDFVDSRLLKCWRNECWVEGNERHVSPATVCTLLKRYASSIPDSGAHNWDSQRADITITRHWMRSVLWKLASRHGFVSDLSNDKELRPKYVISIATDAIVTCESFGISTLEVHGIGLTEKLYDIITSALEFMETRQNPTSMPLNDDPSLGHGNVSAQTLSPCRKRNALASSGTGSDAPEPICPPAGLCNRYLAIFASFMGGDHPFLGPYMQKLCGLDIFGP